MKENFITKDTSGKNRYNRKLMAPVFEAISVYEMLTRSHVLYQEFINLDPKFNEYKEAGLIVCVKLNNPVDIVTGIYFKKMLGPLFEVYSHNDKITIIREFNCFRDWPECVGKLR